MPSPRPDRPVRHTLTEVAAFTGAEAPPDSDAVTVTGLAQDSRQVRPGDVYLARPGAHTHGADYATPAADAGAVAALTDAAGRTCCEAAGLPTLVVDAPGAVMGRLSAWIFGEPARALQAFGVTGTNGKTTTSFLLEAALAGAGQRTGLVGTVESRIVGEVLRSVRTTPEAPDLQALLAVMRERGVSAAVMEVSSHALALGRVAGMSFDVVGFTNLTQDHLEIHGDLETYYRAKASLFTPEYARTGVVTVDDAYGRRLAKEAPIPVVTVSAGDRAADWRVRRQRPSGAGSTFELTGPGGVRVDGSVGLPGAFNVANAALALVMLATAGFDPAELAPALATAVVPGRMEPFTGESGIVAIVDYAHTPAAVEGALAAVRLDRIDRAESLAPARDGSRRPRLIAVFGCGGDRDQGKRPQMGAAAAKAADLVVVTDDNPRSEDPGAIRAAVLDGTREVPAPSRAETVEIPDRGEAIRWALGNAAPGDVVMILGKGHEQGQEIAGVLHPFDDRAVVRDLLAKEST